MYKKLKIFRNANNYKEMKSLRIKKNREVFHIRKKILLQNTKSSLVLFVISLRLYKKWTDIIMIVVWHLIAEIVMIFSQSRL